MNECLSLLRGNHFPKNHQFALSGSWQVFAVAAVAISNRLRVAFLVFSRVCIFALVGIFPNCKNITECNDSVYIILRPLSRAPPLHLAFIGLDSTNSLQNIRFSRVRISCIGNDEPRHYGGGYVDKPVGKILWHRFEAKADIR